MTDIGRPGIFLPAIGGAIVMAVASQAEIPLQPVPITLQSYAALVLGGILGWKAGGSAMLLWLMLGGAGLPFFAAGESGPDHLTGATAGYLIAFPAAAALAGWLTHLFARKSLPRLFCLMIAGHALLLVIGGAWLATSIGVEKAMEAGILPFLPGAVVKSALAALTLLLWFRLPARPSSYPGAT